MSIQPIAGIFTFKGLTHLSSEASICHGNNMCQKAT